MHLLRLTIALLITAATLAVVTLCPGRYRRRLTLGNLTLE